MQVELEGASRHGKNVISNYGRLWNVMKKDSFHGKPAYLLVHPDKTHLMRWVHIKDDTNFKLTVKWNANEKANET